MNFKTTLRNVAIACLALHWSGHAAQTETNVEFIASGLEEHVGGGNDRASVKVYQGDATTVLHKLDFSPLDPVKRLNLPRQGKYRVSFETHEPDDEGATSCTATGELEIVPKQRYSVTLTVLKRTCLLNTGRLDANGAFQQIASTDGQVRRLAVKKR